MVETRPRVKKQGAAAVIESEVCLLCSNEIEYYALGPCGHTNICAKCSLRIRLLMNDYRCPLCKQELTEIVVTARRGLTWDHFDKTVRLTCDTDREDDTIYYTDRASKIEGMKLRTLNCLFPKCTTRTHFPNHQSLRMHMESAH